MPFTTMNDVPRPSPCITVRPQPDCERKQRIFAAIGLTGSQDSRVDQPSLVRYYDYLTAHLELPFVACYPRPSTPAQAAIDCCEAIELLNPRTDPCGMFDGIYCQIRKGRFLVKLPLVELTALAPNKNLELLADYEYWFWHWRD
ncbi:MAG: calcium-binding protein [Planctomycetota bacterium]